MKSIHTLFIQPDFCSKTSSFALQTNKNQSNEHFLFNLKQNYPLVVEQVYLLRENHGTHGFLRYKDKLLYHRVIEKNKTKTLN